MKTVLITGANRGIGFEIARQLAQREFHVVIAARSPQQAEKAQREIERVGKVSVLAFDVSDSASITRAAESFAAIGPLDVLINNAGIYPDEGVSILTIPRDAMVSTFQTNAFGPLEVTQRFLPYLKRAPAGRVINVSSGLGEIDGLEAGIPSYGLSKLALNGITIMLAEALKQFGIAVNAMCPGWVRTEMGGSAAPRSVAEGADTAVWLAADADAKLTGNFFRDRKEIEW
jgi:NAD(P)-dependent dehydrogenase (short-subunit alcohol dehydrogenase family)